MTVLGRFERAALTHPDSVAVVDGNERVTYRELDERATQIAHTLIKAGVGSETLVGVFLDRAVDLLAGLLAIWKSGGAYLPLDPGYPPDRLAFMLEDSSVGVVLTEDSLVGFLPATGAQIICLGNFPEAIQMSGHSFKPVRPTADQLAYVVYTSGSSGKPKGVAICHGGLANVVEAIRGELGLDASDVVLSSATISFDISILEMSLPLISGAGLHIVDRFCAADGAQMIKAIRISGATVILGTPTSWRLLIEAGWQGSAALQLVSGGEVLPASLARTLSRLCRSVWNHYGPTEATICATTELASANPEKVTIGRPIANVRVYLLDEDHKRVPPGEIGEMYIGGAGVGRGYLNRPELNKARFLPDPFASTPGARMYKTGDLARGLTDGRLEFLGRIDGQVKIRGFRIELEEIEEIIGQYPGIQTAAVQAVERGADDYRLMAFVVSKTERQFAGLKEFLRKTLPWYMVPSEFIAVKSLPVSPNGKVDRKALKDLHLRPVLEEKPVEQPVDEIEASLKSIWQQLLKISPISVTDDFFDLGGHSLLATRMFVEIDRRLHTKVPLSTLVGHPTIRGLAACIRHSVLDGDWPGLVTIQAGASRVPLFVVHGLGGSLFSFRALAAELGPDQPVYGLQRSSNPAAGQGRPTIEALASKYVDEIQTIYPLGPYNLAGHSSGGIVAFEMASQLRGLGKEVGLLALLDCDYPAGTSAPNPSAGLLSTLVGRARYIWRRCAAEGLNALVKRKFYHEKIKLRYRLLKHWPRTSYKPRLFGTEAYLALSAKQYVPQIYGGDIMLFIAEESLEMNRNFGAGWAAKVLGKLEMEEIPGTHQTILDLPNVAKLAREFRLRMHQHDSTTALNEERDRAGHGFVA
jgi:amino acid adenylation domain-containing protein